MFILLAPFIVFFYYYISPKSKIYVFAGFMTHSPSCLKIFESNLANAIIYEPATQGLCLQMPRGKDKEKGTEAGAGCGVE